MSYHIVDGALDVEAIRLEIVRLRCQRFFDSRYLESVQTDVFVDEIARRMILSMEAKVASRKFAVKTVRFPATWWDAFKQRFFTPRMLKRWPVQFDEVSLEASAYHPDIAIPDHKTFVEVLVASSRRAA